jgi:lipopolysaccharide/colanic/teichoic acid biosynthesis glycosyltransferase
MSNRHHHTVAPEQAQSSGPYLRPPSSRTGRHRTRREVLDRIQRDASPPVVAVPVHRAPYGRFVKPVADRIVAGALLVLLAPLLAVVAVVVRIALGSPIVYRQERVGLGGQRFEMLKFRTMEADRRVAHVPVAHDRREDHRADHDPRHTTLGRVLRRSSLDELPQLWNVLRGDMSIVGPRPELVSVVARYDDWQHARHAVRPGLTGLWQVRTRDDTPMHLCVHDDLDYIERIGPIADLVLLAATPIAVITHRGR